jgi:hypothetical protein
VIITVRSRKKAPGLKREAGGVAAVAERSGARRTDERFGGTLRVWRGEGILFAPREGYFSNAPRGLVRPARKLTWWPRTRALDQILNGSSTAKSDL